MYKLVTKSEATTRVIADSYKAINYVTKEFSRNFSLAVNVACDHIELETSEYDRIYYVIKGQLVIEVEGNKLDVCEGDCIFITKATEYRFSGTFEAVAVNQPAFGT